jgi:hypothetical protein
VAVSAKGGSDAQVIVVARQFSRKSSTDGLLNVLSGVPAAFRQPFCAREDSPLPFLSRFASREGQLPDKLEGQNGCCAAYGGRLG